MGDGVISCLLIAFSIGYLAVTARLPATVGVTVGPKGFPLLVAALLITTSLVLLWQSLKSSGKGDSAAPPSATPRRADRLILVVAAAVGYVVALTFVGYVVATFLFLATVLMIWHRGHLLLNLSVATGAAMGAYVLISLLQISLPEGLFGLP